MFPNLQRTRVMIINLNCRCHMFSMVTNSDTIHAKQCRISQTQNLACKGQVFSYSSVWSDRIKKKVMVRDCFFKNKNVHFQMLSPENPAMKENLHHIYRLLPIKMCTSHYFLLQVSHIFNHHSILEPIWKFLTNLKIVLSLCFLTGTEKNQNGKNSMEEL